MAVTTMDPDWHHLGSLIHFSSKQAPQLNPSLKSTVLNAAVSVPYPVLNKFPYPQDPPANVPKYFRRSANKSHINNIHKS